MAKSIKLNYILNLVNTGTKLFFPLITFPYICRVIGVEGVGLADFYNSIIGYITLFTCLGIPLYGIREVARLRDDSKEVAKTTVEILLLHSFLVFIGYIFVLFLCLFVPDIQRDIPLFLTLSLTLFFTAIGCEWFYQGIEDFVYITIRGIVVQIITIVLLFVFVKTENDLLYYGCYCVIGVLGGNIFNFFRLKKYIVKANFVFSDLHVFRHLRPALRVFFFNITVSFYIRFNPVLLGFLKNDIAVGLYSASVKLITILISLSACLGSVMMPRLSNLLENDSEIEFNRLIQKSYDLTILLTLPITFGLIVTAPYVIELLCGIQFLESILASQVIAPIILMVGISNVIGIQFLYPKGKISLVTLCCGIGAFFDLSLCVILVPFMSYLGAAIAYLAAETVTTLSMIWYTKRELPIVFINKNHILCLVGAIIMSLSVLCLQYVLNISKLYSFGLQIVVGGIVYILFLWMNKEDIVYGVFSSVFKLNKM